MKSSHTALAVPLVKLRTGLPPSVISKLFDIKKKYCSRAYSFAREASITSFVPDYLGLSHFDKNGHE